ncbi:hypothetical protein [Peribacillus butanolivorans]|uniref:hypothetical protein n=1 Tax=Peribacillus butanolivorans TaxID=421767 RepID=UPI0038204366
MNNEKELRDNQYPVEGEYCSNEGKRVCEGDQWFVCKNNHWKNTHKYCESDSTCLNVDLK